MNGVHDMGGMHRFGPVEPDEETFRAQWEKRVHAMVATAFTRGIGLRNVDAARDRENSAVRLSAVELLRALAGRDRDWPDCAECARRGVD